MESFKNGAELREKRVRSEAQTAEAVSGLAVLARNEFPKQYRRPAVRTMVSLKDSPGHCRWGQHDGEGGSVLKPGQQAT